MALRAIALLALAASAAMFGGTATAALADDAPTRSVLTEMEAGYENLYKQATASLVRVSVAQSAAAVLDSRPGLKAAFDDYRKNLPQNGPPGNGPPGGGRGRGDRNGPRQEPAGTGPAFGGRGPGGGPGGFTQLVSGFLAQRAKQLEDTGKPADKEEADILRGMALRVALNRNGAFQGEMSAIVIDAAGNALLPTGLLREAHTGASETMKVTLPDGSSAKATFVGSNLYSNYTVINLGTIKGVPPVKWATTKLGPGRALLTITAGSGLASIHLASSLPGEPFGLDHLPIGVEDRAGVYLFNFSGELAAVAPAVGGFADRNALGATRLQREIEFIVREKKDLEPRQLGLKFDASTAAGSPVRTIKVGDVARHSLAEAAGLMKGDTLVSIDNRPIAEMVGGDNRETGLMQLKVDMVTRTTTVPIVVLRAGQEKNLTMPLK